MSEELLRCNSRRHRNKGKKLLTFKRPLVQRNLQQNTLTTPLPALNEVWEGVVPGSTSSGHSGTLLAPDLPWVGPAFHEVLNDCFKL